MTTASAVDLSSVVGSQEPTFSHWPEYHETVGPEVIELAESCGLMLDEWQRPPIMHGFGTKVDGGLAAFQVGIEVPRQNGKGAILTAAELGWIFVVEEPLTIHSAHEFPTALEAFYRLEMVLEANAELSAQVTRTSRSHGEEGFNFTRGRRIRFKTRTKGGTRGFSGGKVIFDEAMVIPDMAHGAILPIVSAQENPQLWYTGSAVNQETQEHGLVFTALRRNGHNGSPNVAWFEWCADPRDEDGELLGPDDLGERAGDPALWAQANPALSIRIDGEYIAKEREALDARNFAVERLGVGDWPSLDALDGSGLTIEAWNKRISEGSMPKGAVCFAFDVTPNRTAGSISVAGWREDGRPHVELVDRRSGTDWIVGRMTELLAKHQTVEQPVCDGRSPAAALLPKLARADIEPVVTNGQEHAQACGILFDAVGEEGDGPLAHLGQPELAAAVRSAVKRPLGDAWAWSRKASGADISPLVSATLALWGLETQKPKSKVPLVAVM